MKAPGVGVIRRDPCLLVGDEMVILLVSKPLLHVLLAGTRTSIAHRRVWTTVVLGPNN